MEDMKPSKPTEICIHLDDQDGLVEPTDGDVTCKNNNNNTLVVKQQPMSSPSNFFNKILNMNAGTTTYIADDENKKKPKTFSDMLFDADSGSSSINNSGTMDSDRQSSVEYTTADEGDSTDEDTIDSLDRHSTKGSKGKGHDSIVDPFVSQLVSAFNFFTCTPVGAFASNDILDDLQESDTVDDGASKASANRRSKRDRKSQSQTDNTVTETRDDAFDDASVGATRQEKQESRDGAAEDNRRGHSLRVQKDRKHIFDHDFGLLVASASSGSSAVGFLKELNGSNSVGEGAIQIRSSIREAMENIVSKSKVGGIPRIDFRRNKDDPTETQSTTTGRWSRKSRRRGLSSSKSVKSTTSKSSKSIVSKAPLFFKK
jgi:hypothetical protein